MALRGNLTDFYVSEKNVEQMYVGARPSKYSSIKEKKLVSIRESSGNSTVVGTAPTGLSMLQFLVAHQGWWWDLPSAVLTYRMASSVVGITNSANSFVPETVYSFLNSLLITSGQTIEQVPQNLAAVITHELNRSIPRSSFRDSLLFAYDWKNDEQLITVNNTAGQQALGVASIRQRFINYGDLIGTTGVAPFATAGIRVVFPMYLISNFFKVNKFWCGDLDFTIQMQLTQLAAQACYAPGTGGTATNITIDDIYLKMNALRLDEVVHNTLISLMEGSGKPVVYPFDAVMVYPQSATLTDAATNLDISYQISNNYVKQLSAIARKQANLALITKLKTAFECIVPTVSTTKIQFRALINGEQYPERPIDYIGEIWELSRECYGLQKNVDVSSSTNLLEYKSSANALTSVAGTNAVYDGYIGKFSIDLPLAQMQNAEFGAVMGKLLSSSAAPVTLSANWQCDTADTPYQVLLLCYHLRLVKVENRAVSVTQV